VYTLRWFQSHGVIESDARMVTNFLFSKVGAQFLRRRFGLVRILHSIVCTDFLFCFSPEGLKQFINMLGQQMVDLNTSLTAVTYMECIRLYSDGRKEQTWKRLRVGSQTD